MDLSNLFLFFCLLLTTGQVSSHGLPPHRHRHQHLHTPTKLFVFGDSYADTGNARKSLEGSWHQPYGITFPGKPAGRFSDGRVLTDFVAKFLGLKTPFPYAWRKLGGQRLRNGMNFAYGGSGVFDTFGDILPNMTTQIDSFERLVNNSLYTKQDLQSSVVLVALAGNDYATYITRTGSIQGLDSFIPQVINQLVLNLRRVYGLGARRVIVTALPPLGCLPRITETNNFQQCNTTQNTAVGFHNLLLQRAVAQLNNETKSSTFFILDLFSSFTTVLEQKGQPQGNLRFESPMKPCCFGISSGYYCGSVDENGNKMYTICSDPKSSFFWDSSHPTQAGWTAVYMTLESSLQQIFRY